MFKKIFITLLVLVVIVGVLVGIKALQIKAMIDEGANFELPPEFVTSASVSEDAWVQALRAVGSFTAVQGVTVSSEVAGKIDKIHFDSGQSVEQGVLLIELDISTEIAQLAAAEANAQLANINLERAKKLRESNTVAQAELDSAEATYLATTAQANNLKAFIEKKRVVAPFTGRLGIRQVDLGQFINNGEPIVSLQALDPIYVDFSLPQQAISKLEEGMTVEVEVDAYPGTLFSGTLTAINPEVDPSTRTIALRATLDNPEGQLLPGMFAQVAVTLPDSKLQKIVPGTAILYNSFGDSVFVITEKDGKKIVEQQFVRVGESRGDFVAISSGPDVGAEIVSTGAFKLRNGVRVEVNNKLATDPKLKPTPSDS